MSSIGSASSVNRPNPSAGASATTAATSVNPAQPNAAPTATQPNAPNVGGSTIVARPVTVGGLAGTTMAATGTVNRFSRDAAFDTYAASGAGQVSRGFIRVDATPIPGGCRIQVDSFHQVANDRVTLYLVAEVLDPQTNQLRAVTLSLLANNDVLNPGGYRGTNYFDVKYDDIDKFLQARNPALKINPGQTTLAVSARFASGHQAGGFGRAGTFRLPVAPGQPQNVVAARIAARNGADEADLPLDMQVAYPQPLMGAVPQLKPGGNILSRLESELKGSSSKEDMTQAIQAMYAMTAKADRGDTSEIERLLGKDWTVTTVNRYWLKDDGSPNLPGKPGTGFFKGFRVDGDGLPIQDPMRDTYMDDGALGMTRHEGAIRLRSNKQATVINVKPGGGRREDKSGIVQRVEVGIELKEGAQIHDATAALRSLASGQWSGTVFNHAQREVSKLDQNLNLQNCLNPWLDVVQNRHKFTVKNVKTGVEIELSLDKVECKTLNAQHANPDGSPRTAEFYVLEAELDHLQLASQNQSSYVAANTTTSGGFTDDAQQDAWLRATSGSVTMDIDPRLHELKDLDNASFRNTSSYKQFRDAIGKLVPALFKKGLGHGRQKAAHAAEVMGLVFFDDQKALAGLRGLVEKGGFAWTPSIEQAFGAALADPARRRTMEQDLVNGTQRNTVSFVQRALGNGVQLDYDVAKVKARVAGRLRSLGLESTPQIDAMLDTITSQKIPPGHLDSYLQRMEQVQDAQVMQQFAQALGVSPAPVPAVDVSHLFGAGHWGATLAANLAAMAIDRSQQAEIEKFFAVAAKNGATALELRGTIQNMRSNPQAYLDQLASNRGLAGHAPRLRADVDALVQRAQPSLQPHYLAVDDALKGFLRQVAQQTTAAEALQFVTNLRSNPQQMLAQQAGRMGIAPPVLAYDMAAVEQLLQPNLANARVVYTPDLKAFAKVCLDAGVPPSRVGQLFAGLANGSDLRSALSANGIYLVGNVTMPKVVFDASATCAWVMQGLGGYGAIIDQGKALTDFVEGMLAQGCTPTQIYNYARYLPSYDRARAAQLANNAPPQTLPRLPIDAGGLAAHLKARMGASWTPALESYFMQVLPQAEQHANFKLNDLYGQNNKQGLINVLASYSGVAAPAGV